MAATDQRVLWNIQNHSSIVLVIFFYRLYDHAAVYSSLVFCSLHFEILLRMMHVGDYCFFVIPIYQSVWLMAAGQMTGI